MILDDGDYDRDNCNDDDDNDGSGGNGDGDYDDNDNDNDGCFVCIVFLCRLTRRHICITLVGGVVVVVRGVGVDPLSLSGA